MTRTLAIVIMSVGFSFVAMTSFVLCGPLPTTGALGDAVRNLPVLNGAGHRVFVNGVRLEGGGPGRHCPNKTLAFNLTLPGHTQPRDMLLVEAVYLQSGSVVRTAKASGTWGENVWVGETYRVRATCSAPSPSRWDSVLVRVTLLGRGGAAYRTNCGGCGPHAREERT